MWIKFVSCGRKTMVQVTLPSHCRCADDFFSSRSDESGPSASSNLQMQTETGRASVSAPPEPGLGLWQARQSQRVARHAASKMTWSNPASSTSRSSTNSSKAVI